MPVIIKRYRNRKLYNTCSKRYITLDEIEELIKDQEEVQVIDNDSGYDITASTLSQIIFELEKKHTAFLPQNLLVSLVQSRGKRIDEIRRNIFRSLSLHHHYDVEIERRINQLIEDGDFSADAGAQILKKLLSIGDRQDEFRENLENWIIELLKERQVPSKDDFQSLIRRVDTLSKKVESYNGNSRTKNEEDEKS